MYHDPRLSIVRLFLRALAENDISYCHWKSNEHVAAAVQGDTDLDLLFDEGRQSHVRELLARTGFHRFQTAWFARYPHIEDFIGIDQRTGRMVHVHAHFRLVVGEKRVKSYHLPWEEAVLARRQWIENPGIYTSDYADELLLLIIRTALKLSVSRRREFDQQRATVDAKREFAWLKQRVSEEELLTAAERMTRLRLSVALSDIYMNGISYERARQFRSDAKCLTPFRRYSAVTVLGMRGTRYLFARASRLNSRRNLLMTRNRRTMARRGLIVAVVGADGSGKSTQVARLIASLTTKVDAVAIYMGSGKGAASWHRSVLTSVLNLARSKPRATRMEARTRNSLTTDARRVTMVRAVKAISLAFEKASKLKRAGKARRCGKVVIADRYPQRAIPGYNDGPLLPDSWKNKSVLHRALFEVERRRFRQADVIAPDLVIKLVGEPATLHARRAEEMTLELITAKQNSILATPFTSATKIARVDACGPIDKVTARIMAEVGLLMSERARNGRPC